MISPLQNLQTLLTIQHQLLANLLQNSGPGAEQMQQTAGQAGTADNSHLLLSHGSQGSEGEVMSQDSAAQLIKETGDFLATTKNDHAPSLKEQIVSLTQTLVQQGHLPSSTLNQPIPVIIPQMLACLGKLHREEKKKQKKKEKGGKKTDKEEPPIDSLLKNIFKMDGV